MLHSFSFFRFIFMCDRRSLMTEGWMSYTLAQIRLPRFCLHRIELCLFDSKTFVRCPSTTFMGSHSRLNHSTALVILSNLFTPSGGPDEPSPSSPGLHHLQLRTTGVPWLWPVSGAGRCLSATAPVLSQLCLHQPPAGWTALDCVVGVELTFTVSQAGQAPADDRRLYVLGARGRG